MNLRVQNIDISYTRNGSIHKVLSDFDLEIREGTLVAIMGANGAGKSSLLRVLAGLQEPSQGLVFWDEKPLTSIPISSRSHHAACLFSDYGRVEGMSVRELVSLGRLPFTNWLGKLSRNDHNIVVYSMAQLGIEDHANYSVMSLSDGEFQKVLLARTLAQQTGCILLDEPTTHLDLKSSLNLILSLRELTRDHSKTIVFSSHDVQLATKYADLLIVLDTSGNHASDTPERVFNMPIINSIIDPTKVIFENGNIVFK